MCEPATGGELKVHFSQQPRTPLDSGFHGQTAVIGARLTAQVSQRDIRLERSALFLRGKRARFTLATKPFSSFQVQQAVARTVLHEVWPEVWPEVLKVGLKVGPKVDFLRVTTCRILSKSRTTYQNRFELAFCGSAH